MTQPIDLALVVLAGGDASRFGSDKLIAEIDGVPMLARVVREARLVVKDVFLSVQHGEGSIAHETLGVRLIPDLVPGIGPIAGLHSALLTLNAEWVLMLAGDLPLLTADAIRACVRSRRPEVDAIIARDPGGRIHPLTACYRSSIRPIVESSIHDKSYSMRGLISRLRSVEYVTLPATELLNVNRPDDLPKSDPG